MKNLQKDIDKLNYKLEGLKRMSIRKQNRLKKFTKNREFRRKSQCTCGEDQYCYCGDGTPYSY